MNYSYTTLIFVEKMQMFKYKWFWVGLPRWNFKKIAPQLKVMQRHISRWPWIEITQFKSGFWLLFKKKPFSPLQLGSVTLSSCWLRGINCLVYRSHQQHFMCTEDVVRAAEIHKSAVPSGPKWMHFQQMDNAMLTEGSVQQHTTDA